MKILLFSILIICVSAQRITTIQLDGIQYFISRMNPYSPELNYFLAYQYCRSLGLQLVSFETKEKADTMMRYLKNAGYMKYDFWTSGNNLGTDMYLWMSTGLPFNTTFDYIDGKKDSNESLELPTGTEPQRVARGSAGIFKDGCIAMTSPQMTWRSIDCMLVKDFICEQTRCYYYNYGSIPVSATQGNKKGSMTNTMMTTAKTQISTSAVKDIISSPVKPGILAMKSYFPQHNQTNQNRDLSFITITDTYSNKESHEKFEETGQEELVTESLKMKVRFENLPSISSLFTDSTVREDVFSGLDTHEVHSTTQDIPFDQQIYISQSLRKNMENTRNSNDETHTVGPYNEVDQDYQADHADFSLSDQLVSQTAEDDSSTILPESELSYKYSIKLRKDGKVLDPI